MLSALKARSPAPANSSRPNTTMARRLRQKATRVLNTDARGWTCGPPSVARRSLEHVAQEDPPFGHRELVGLESREHLISTLALQSERQWAFRKVASIA